MCDVGFRNRRPLSLPRPDVTFVGTSNTLAHFPGGSKPFPSVSLTGSAPVHSRLPVFRGERQMHEDLGKGLWHLARLFRAWKLSGVRGSGMAGARIASLQAAGIGRGRTQGVALAGERCSLG